jgi:hypothetical protein
MCMTEKNQKKTFDTTSWTFGNQVTKQFTLDLGDEIQFIYALQVTLVVNNKDTVNTESFTLHDISAKYTETK